MVPVVIPEVIMGISLLIFFASIGLALGYVSVILSHVTFCFPFVMVAVRARLAGLDPSLEEAAMDLGATPLRALLGVIVPFLMPALISGALMAFTLSMDELIVTYFTYGPGAMTLPVKMYGMARVGMSPSLNAISTVLIVVTAVLMSAADFVRRRAV
jgi:spermidine/putrescine transport system permease protein